MFTQCDVNKNVVGHYLHNDKSSKFRLTLFDIVSHRRVTRCQFYYIVEFIAKLKSLVLGVFHANQISMCLDQHLN